MDSQRHWQIRAAAGKLTDGKPVAGAAMPTDKKQKIAGLCFECTGCGACCTGDAGHYVEITPEEQDAMRAQLNISHQWFRRRYVVRVDEDTEGIRLGADGRCPFLDAKRRCRIYAVRPLQCRTYPWWPELMQQRAAWRAEAQRCEGIGRGAAVPVATIQHALRLQIRRAQGKKKLPPQRKRIRRQIRGA